MNDAALSAEHAQEILEGMRDIFPFWYLIISGMVLWYGVQTPGRRWAIPFAIFGIIHSISLIGSSL